MTFVTSLTYKLSLLVTYSNGQSLYLYLPPSIAFLHRLLFFNYDLIFLSAMQSHYNILISLLFVSSSVSLVFMEMVRAHFFVHFSEPNLIPNPFMQVGGLFGQPPFAPQHQMAPPMTQPPLPPIGQPPAVGPPMMQPPGGGIQRPTSLAPGNKTELICILTICGIPSSLSSLERLA